MTSEYGGRKPMDDRPGWCDGCFQRWPCDTVDYETRIAALEAENRRLVKALELARGALKIAHKNAGRADPHYMVLDVTRIEIERINAALAAAATPGDRGEGADG